MQSCVTLSDLHLFKCIRDHNWIIILLQDLTSDTSEVGLFYHIVRPVMEIAIFHSFSSFRMASCRQKAEDG